MKRGSYRQFILSRWCMYWLTPLTLQDQIRQNSIALMSGNRDNLLLLWVYTTLLLIINTRTPWARSILFAWSIWFIKLFPGVEDQDPTFYMLLRVQGKSVLLKLAIWSWKLRSNFIVIILNRLFRKSSATSITGSSGSLFSSSFDSAWLSEL